MHETEHRRLHYYRDATIQPTCCLKDEEYADVLSAARCNELTTLVTGRNPHPQALTCAFFRGQYTAGSITQSRCPKSCTGNVNSKGQVHQTVPHTSMRVCDGTRPSISHPLGTPVRTHRPHSCYVVCARVLCAGILHISRLAAESTCCSAVRQRQGASERPADAGAVVAPVRDSLRAQAVRTAHPDAHNSNSPARNRRTFA